MPWQKNGLIIHELLIIGQYWMVIHELIIRWLMDALAEEWLVGQFMAN